MHTKEPWTKRKVEENERTGDPEHYIISNQYSNLARVDHGGIEWEEFEANARLIKAAPNMLETLEAIKALINGEYDNPSLLKMGELLPRADDNILHFAGNAIRKAKGNQEMSDARKTLVSFAMLGAAFKGE